jgi:hypothetical protein
MALTLRARLTPGASAGPKASGADHVGQAAPTRILAGIGSRLGTA